MLQINLRHLEEHAVRLQGALPVAELDFGPNDELIRAEQPLLYDLTVEQLHDSLLVTGLLRMTLDCDCARCLKKFKFEVKLAGWALHLPLEGEDKVSVHNDSVDLTPFLREDMLLNFPQHPLCRTDCAGLNKKSKVSPAAGREKSKPAAWAELDKLKLK
jgi:uncharacterized protein